MRTLVIDIETRPATAEVWSLFKVTVSLNQLRDPGGVISFAAKWAGEKRVMFFSDFHNGHEEMVNAAWELLDQADAVVHYNGTSFDMPHLRREFLLAELPPPSPWKDIDLLRAVRSKFRFISSKLDNVSSELGIGSKVKHEGHSLWTACVAGDAKAWGRMRRYNKHDVVLTDQLYERLLPWLPGHPNVGLYSGKPGCCPRCGSESVQRRGSAYTPLGTYAQVRCNDCGGWSRTGRRESTVELRSA